MIIFSLAGVGLFYPISPPTMDAGDWWVKCQVVKVDVNKVVEMRETKQIPLEEMLLSDHYVTINRPVTIYDKESKHGE